MGITFVNFYRKMYQQQKLCITLITCCTIVVALLNLRSRINHDNNLLLHPENLHTRNILDHQEMTNFKARCFPNSLQTVENLEKILHHVHQSDDTKCRKVDEIFNRIYQLTSEEGRLEIPDTFRQKVSQWMKGDESLVNSMNKQTVVYVHNRILHQGTVYNPLRQKRPESLPDPKGKQNLDRLSAEVEHDCDFCNYKQHTAVDMFGHMESLHAFTMANAFKLSAWHTIVAFRNHHPLKWTLEELEAGFALGLQWVEKVHAVSPENRYPMVLWDQLPAAGSSQLHPHFHVLVTKNGYHGDLEQWYQQARQYKSRHHTSYFSDLLALSLSLGLAVELGRAKAVIPLTKQIDREILLMAESPGKDLYRLLFYTVQMFYEIYHKYSFSLAMMLPPVGEHTSDLPVIIRLAPRGSAGLGKSDATSMNLFTAAEVNADPFQMASQLRQFIRTKITENT